jgi:uncharacterized protein YbjT (DUF2867 family)
MSLPVAVFGASGLTGGELLKALLADGNVSEVRAAVRRPLGINHPKLRESVIAFDDQAALQSVVGGCETVYVAVGTTNRKVGGDKDAYRRVDFDIPVEVAKACAAMGVYGISLVSSVGADPENQYNFYIKLKGVVEETVSEQGVPQTVIVRPSVLLGKRSEKRTGERIAQVGMSMVSGLLSGRLKKYRVIRAEDVARAMLMASRTLPKGIHILEYGDMMDLSKRYLADPTKSAT